MLIKEATSRAKADLAISSDDYRLSNRHIYSILLDIRSELFRQEIGKNGQWDNIDMQVISCFLLERVDISECCDFKSGHTLLKSKMKLPKLLDFKDGKVISGVYLPTGDRLDKTSMNDYVNSLGRRFKVNKPRFFLRNEFLYITDYNDDATELYATVEAVFERPEEVERLNKCKDETVCFYYGDFEFNIPGYLASRLFRMAKAEIAQTLGIPQDNTNDAKQINVEHVQNTN